MKHIKKLTPLVAVLAMGGEPVALAQADPIRIDAENKIFVYAAGGLNSLDVEANPSSASEYNSGALDDSGTVLEVGVGYRWNSKLFSTLSYQSTELDIATVDVSFLSLNYQIGDSDYNPYIGVILGYSTLNWDEKPDTIHIDSDLESTAMAYGLQVGASMAVSDSLSVFAKYGAVFHDHNIDIETPGHKEIAHNSSQNLVLGVQYGV